MSAFDCKYSWKGASRIKANAQKAGELCEQLENTVGLTAKNLLNASRNPDDVLYNEFEWDDEIAAENYRESQARHIINSLIVVPAEKVENDTTATRAFYCLKEDCMKSYKSIQSIIQRPDLTEQLLSQAEKELEAFENKYKSLQDNLTLKPIYSQIQKFNQSKGENNGTI